MTDHIETYLRELIGRAEDAPLLRDLAAEDLGTETGTAAVARAALCWLRDGTPEAVAERLRAELAETDYYVRHRLSEASRDLSAGFLPIWRKNGAWRRSLPWKTGWACIPARVIMPSSSADS